MAQLILIGPVGVGKTTTAQLLAEQLSLPHHVLDQLRWSYFQQIGYDPERVQQLAATQGIAAVLAHWERFEVHALEQVLKEYPTGVIDVGGGYTVASDPVLARRIRQMLAPYPYVVLLLPAPEREASIQILTERLAGQLPEDFPLQEHVRHHFGTQNLAKYVVYTYPKSPEAIRDEILRRLDGGLDASV